MSGAASRIRPTQATAAAVTVMEARGIGKTYGPNVVLTGIDISIASGEVHAVIGENGAGKSTLMKILSGHVAPTSGTMEFVGESVVFKAPIDAEHAGIVLVHQEILLADALTVTENLFLGRELGRWGMVDDRSMRSIAGERLASIGSSISPDAIVGSLPLADRQLVQIARALLDDSRLVIFDEPTAVLTSEEVSTFLDLVRQLRAEGKAILYISHRLGEVEALADRVTVLRDGQLIGTYEGSSLTQADMARLMVGRELSQLYPPRSQEVLGDSTMRVEHARVPGYVEDISFTLRRGEILGFGGMIGAGRTELFEGLLGLRSGTVKLLELDGRSVRITKPLDAIEAGIAYLTEDRKGKGLLLKEKMGPNLTLTALDSFNPGLLLDGRREGEALDAAVAEYDIRVRNRGVQVGQLSGGNQQKLLLAKILLTDPSVVVIDEPTRGIDIGNKSQIYAFIQQLVGAGKACIVISSEMQELIGICDRILVIRDGRIAGELTGEAMTEGNVVLLATGARSEERSDGEAAE